MTDAAPFAGLISICIPTYKRSSFLRFCLDSCRAQADANIEIVVHDDTPDDRIEAIVQEFSDLPITYIRNDPPLGLVGKLNNFLERARGDWSLILCEDDILLPGFLETVRQRIAAQPSATTVRCRNVLIDAEGNTLRLDNESPELSGSLDYIDQIFRPTSTAYTINLTGFVFRREKLLAEGGFAQCHKAYLTDRFALLRLARNGDAVCDPQALCGIRRHSGSISSGFDPDFSGAIASVRDLENEARSTIDGLATSAPPDLVARARKAVDGFVARNLSRSLDRSFAALISSPDRISRRDKQRHIEALHQHGVKRFRSLPVYRILLDLPTFARRPLARAFLDFKRRAQL